MNLQAVLADLGHFLPETVLTLGVLAVVLVDSIVPKARGRDGLCRWVAAAALATALCFAWIGSPAGEIWSGMIVVDPLLRVFRVLLIVATLLVVLLFTPRNSAELRGVGQGELYSLLLALALANLLLAGSADLVMLYLALETVSITSYILVGYAKGDVHSNEASLKYVLFGAVSTGAMLYGLSILYGFSGTTSLAGIREALAATTAPAGVLAVLAVLAMAGFGFKIAAVPFHFWCPDVYQGAPTPIAAFLSVGPKAAGFAVLARFFLTGWPEAGGPGALRSLDWPSLIVVISAITMTLGNVAALTQTNMKRLLAYSSIGHAGFILMGLAAASPNGTKGMVVYLLVYLAMNLGAFFVVALIHAQDGTFDLRDYAGLSRRSPLLAVAMAFFLLSLAGLPPLVGFVAKLYVFAAVIERGLVVFAVVGALNAALAAYYYFRVLRAMIVDDPEAGRERGRFTLAASDATALVVLSAANLVPLVFWNAFERFASASSVLLRR